MWQGGEKGCLDDPGEGEGEAGAPRAGPSGDRKGGGGLEKGGQIPSLKSKRTGHSTWLKYFIIPRNRILFLFPNIIVAFHYSYVAGIDPEEEGVYAQGSMQGRRDIRRLRKGTNGVGTNGVTTIFKFFDGGTFWVLPLTNFYLPRSARAHPFHSSVKSHYLRSSPIGVDPLCPQPKAAGLAAGSEGGVRGRGGLVVRRGGGLLNKKTTHIKQNK